LHQADRHRSTLQAVRQFDRIEQVLQPKSGFAVAVDREAAVPFAVAECAR
jgi:hypothetical protein